MSGPAQVGLPGFEAMSQANISILSFVIVKSENVTYSLPRTGSIDMKPLSSKLKPAFAARTMGVGLQLIGVCGLTLQAVRATSRPRLVPIDTPTSMLGSKTALRPRSHTSPLGPPSHRRRAPAQ